MKKIFFAGACLVALAAAPAMAQASKPAVVVVRVSDAAAGGQLVIVREGGKTEELEFANSVSMKSLALSGTLMQQVFGNLYAEGYTLKGTFGV